MTVRKENRAVFIGYGDVEYATEAEAEQSFRYTKGPWRWDTYYELDGGWLVSGDTPVLDYAGCGTHDTIAKPADRQLIAAAPDLLEALEEVYAWAKAKNIALPSPRARAAILKAGGKA